MWANMSFDEREVLEEIEASKSDRATAIVAAAILEDRLTKAIQSKLRNDKDAVSRLFRQSGPLGSFSAKIDLGYLMGLYSPEIYKDMHTIREIRNAFAHGLREKDFCSTRIGDLCRNIKNFDRNFIIQGVHRRDKIKRQAIFTRLDPDSQTFNREKFVRTCQILVLLLSLFLRKRQPRLSLLR
jgi:DNA-binding MltR family transcriptional regulator